MTSIATGIAPVSTTPEATSGPVVTGPVTGPVTGGVDTHGQTHHVALIDAFGRPVADREFVTTPAGYRALTEWLASHGAEVDRVGVEGTGAYGAGLARHLAHPGSCWWRSTGPTARPAGPAASPTR